MRREDWRYLGLGLAVCLVGALFGVVTAQAEAPLGPHRAVWSVGLAGEVVVDLGPLGAAILDSPAGPLGLDVAVHEIPSGTSSDVLSGLAADAVSYTQLASQPRAAVAAALGELVDDAAGRAAIVAGFGLAGMALLRLSGVSIVLTRRRLAAAGLVGAGVLLVLVIPALCPTHPAGQRAEVLAGTAFEDVRMTGRLADLLNSVGPPVVALYEQNERFYDDVAAQVRGGFRAAAAVPAPRSGWDLAPAPPSDRITTAVLVTDLHCNVSMGRVVAALVQATAADLVLNAGDTVVSGTAAEAFCVDAFAGDFDVPVLVANGNHDSPLTGQQERAAGWEVLHGAVVESAGLRVLGDADPTGTRLGAGTVQVREETIAEMGQRLGEAACDAGGVDVLLIHHPAAARAAIGEGCATLALSGHIHRQLGPVAVGADAWRYVGSSAGGANDGGRTIGVLTSSADVTVIRFADGRPLDWSVVTVHPDATVTVERWTPFPSPL